MSAHKIPRMAATSAACLCDITVASLNYEFVTFTTNKQLFTYLHHSLQNASCRRVEITVSTKTSKQYKKFLRLIVIMIFKKCYFLLLTVLSVLT